MTLKVGMQHWVLQYFQVCSNDDPELTLTYFMARSSKIMDFSETIVIYDTKVDSFSLLNEYMNHYKYRIKGQGHSLSFQGQHFQSTFAQKLKPISYGASMRCGE